MAARSGTLQASAFGTFRGRALSWLWTAHLTSPMGSALPCLAGSIRVFRETGSALCVSRNTSPGRFRLVGRCGFTVYFPKEGEICSVMV